MTKREQKAFNIVKETLDDLIGISDYTGFYKVCRYEEDECDDCESRGRVVVCVDGYEVEVEVMVDLVDESVWVYIAECYKRCDKHPKDCLIEFVGAVIDAVKRNKRCNKEKCVKEE